MEDEGSDLRRADPVGGHLIGLCVSAAQSGGGRGGEVGGQSVHEHICVLCFYVLPT